MAVVRDIEPWDALLDAGREDERLVMQAAQHRRAGARRRAARRAARGRRGRAARARDRAAVVAPGRGAARRLGGADDRHHRHRLAASRSASSCRRSTRCAATRRARALYLYPTKALAQDQARALHALGVERARPAIYDGDTPREQRSQIRRRANVVLTNPDMLHVGILPNHRAWADLFANLAVVVVDEAHVYRGVFGSHVANVLRRLRRIAAAYGTEPRFLLASATIANPVELAERLTGLDDITVIDRDGSPGAKQDDRDVEPADHRRAARHAALARWPRRPTCSPSSSSEGARTIVLHEVAQGRRADGAASPSSRWRTAGGPSWPRGSRPTAPATRRSSGASSSSGWSTASCSASSPPTRWSWASTSARSTRRSA